jgi:phosphatidylinositol glycan class P protein
LVAQLRALSTQAVHTETRAPSLQLNDMPPRSRGKPTPSGLLSKSTPNLPTLLSLEASEQHGSPADASRNADTRPIANTLDGALSKETAVEFGEDEHEDPLDREESGSSDTEEDEEEGEEEEEQPPARRPLYTSRSHSQLPRQTASTLFPPFYNRPPVPLPPSPSLKSLLRPSFPSRRTTPDSSDMDLPTGGLAPPEHTCIQHLAPRNLRPACPAHPSGISEDPHIRILRLRAIPG